MGALAVLRHLWVTRVRGTDRARDVSDAVLTGAAGLVLVAAGLSGLWSGRAGGSGWWHAVPLVLGCLAMLGRRRRPVAALSAGAVLFAADVALGGSIGMLLVLFDLVYSAALHAGPTAVLRLRAASWALVSLSLVLGWTATRDLRVTAFLALQTFVVLTTPLWWGLAVRRERELADLARARADDLRDLADLRAAEARAEERGRMARDLHDAVAGNVSAVALHAEAALARPPVPGAERERAALEAVRASALTSLEEMRAMILLLRADAGPVAAAPRLDRLGALVAGARTAGLTVTLDAGPLPELPAAVEQAAYRVLQEALTNAVKHAPGGRAEVAVGTSGGRLALRVDSADGPGGSGGPGLPGAGLGLLTMRERTESLGGRFAAGWADDARTRWSVAAELPLAVPAGVGA
ncbi:sensor histidine kinase [Geodermatophilus sp. FMUSA9-8]|uniref:sensor histidine kinase n=1 Tax=Geodermatophilus sp. FMUSA9-8 TaxID=3120155 RepID=UPI0030094F82